MEEAVHEHSIKSNSYSQADADKASLSFHLEPMESPRPLPVLAEGLDPNLSQLTWIQPPGPPFKGCIATPH